MKDFIKFIATCILLFLIFSFASYLLGWSLRLITRYGSVFLIGFSIVILLYFIFGNNEDAK